MKASYLLGFFMVLLVCSCKTKENADLNQNPKTFTLNAKLEGLKSDYLIYSEQDDRYPNGYRRDTLWVKDQKFTFKDSVDNYKMYYIDVLEKRSWMVPFADGSFGRASLKAGAERLWFIGYPGAVIECEGKLGDYMVDAKLSDAEGVNQDLSLINSRIFPLIDKTNEISYKIETEDLSDEQRKVYRDSTISLYKKIIDIKKEFIQSHPKSIASSYIFMDAYYRRGVSKQEAEELFNNMDSAILSGTPFYDEVKGRIDADNKTAIGRQAPEMVTTHTLDGSEFKLSSLKGNYVLIDYWGTWCGPCMAEMPKIKAYYKKYADKNFEVLGVNEGDNPTKWKKTIEERGLNWKHIKTTKENNLLIYFNVRGFPTKVLLDPDGKIIYSSNNNEKKDMYKMLDSIFSQS